MNKFLEFLILPDAWTSGHHCCIPCVL